MSASSGRRCGGPTSTEEPRIVPEPKQIRLAINLLASGRHNASWKTLDDPAGLSTDVDVFLQIARTAERGLLDGIFLADNYAGLNEESLKRPVPALYANPATVAREIASLDHVSKGRAAWNIITSQHDHTLRMFGLDSELPQAAKYDKAE